MPMTHLVQEAQRPDPIRDAQKQLNDQEERSLENNLTYLLANRDFN